MMNSPRLWRSHDKATQATGCEGTSFRKILVSAKFVSAILGPEMGASILWTPGNKTFFLQDPKGPNLEKIQDLEIFKRA